MKSAMLVHVGRPEKVHQGIALPGLVAPVTPRLLLTDDGERIFGDPTSGSWPAVTDHPFSDVIPSFSGGFANGEGRMASGVLVIGPDEVIDEIIETASGVIQEVSEIEGPCTRREVVGALDEG
jgi:hypothetical protein